MMNYVADDRGLTVPAPHAVVSGQGLQMGTALFGVCGASADAGDDVALWRRGVFWLNKNSGQTYAIGDILYWDNVNFVLTNVPSANLAVGFAALPSLPTDAMATVCLK